MNLEECLRLAKDAGFDGIELNYDLDNDLSPKSGTEGIRGDPPPGREDRHRHQRRVLVPLLAVSR
jgi:sugar phosphate isomerase/epimerase